MFMTRVNMVGEKCTCRWGHFSRLSKLFLNDGTTATTKPGSDKDCMQQLFGRVSHITHDLLFTSYFRGITAQFSALLLYHKNFMLS
mgnify:FL=1